MKSTVAALQVDAHGRVIAANRSARDRFPGCEGRSCAEVIQLRAPTGERVCTAACWPAMARAEGSSDVEGTTGDGDPARLVCSALGETGTGAHGTILVVPPRPPVTEGGAGLSGREREVVRGLLQGRSVPEIAAALGIAASTVRTHVDHVKEKLGVRKNTEVVARALALGLGDG